MNRTIFSSIASSATLLTLFIAPLSSAQGISDRVQISIGNDAYMAGEKVTLTEAVNGNMNVAGGSVTIGSTVSGDLQVAGGEVRMTGSIRDNMRVLGGTVSISGRVNGSLTVVAGQVRIEKDAVIGGGVLAAGGNIIIDGTVNGMLKATGGEVMVNGIVNGITELRGDNATINGIVEGNSTVAATSFVVGETARFGGNLDYWSTQGQRDFSGVVQGTATYRENLRVEHGEGKKDVAARFLAGLSLFSLFSAAFVIGLLLFFTRNFFKETAKDLQKQPWISLLTGFLFVILTPIIAIVLLATLIGIPVAIAIVLGYAITLYFSTALTSLVLARWIELKYKKKWHPVTVFFAALGVFIVLKLLWIIPFLGWLAAMILIFMGLGAMLSMKYRILQKVR